MAAMADLFGCSRQHVYKLMGGTHFPAWPLAQQIADALEIPVDELWERE